MSFLGINVTVNVIVVFFGGCSCFFLIDVKKVGPDPNGLDPYRIAISLLSFKATDRAH